MRFAAHVAFAALVALLAVACEAPPAMQHVPADVPPPPPSDEQVAAEYPTLAELYQGAQGIYRGCGPNGNVCHNARQYPNMNTLGALAFNVGRPCNQLQDDPTRIDDWCERQGDSVAIGDTRLLLGYIQRVADATDTQGARWAIVTQGDFPDLSDQPDVRILRVQPDGHEDRLIAFDGSSVTPDPMRHNAVFVQLDPGDDDSEATLEAAGVPANVDAIQFGDPNRNGVYGVTLGNLLIYPGHPERSYIIRRLTDPSAGPLMPLANCCFWSKDSLRALWCWIANLTPDGANALDPIDYTVCPPGPMEDLDYPTPGPMCENGGLCPVHVRTPIPDDPTWANVYSNVIVSRCGGSGCHRGGDTSGGLDMGTSDVAYQNLVMGTRQRVVPGDPAMSLMYQRITQDCSMTTSCSRMPLGQGPLLDHDIGVIRQWIANGALQNGTVGDGGVMVDAGGMDAGGMDAGGMDAGGMDADTGDVVAPVDAADDTAAVDAGGGTDAGDESVGVDAGDVDAGDAGATDAATE